MKKIVLTGGGTAGHVFPALALIKNLDDYQIHYIGSSGIEKEILKKYSNVVYHEIPAVKLVRSLTLKNLLIPFKLLDCTRKAKKILREISPNIIFSKGGFVSVPVALAGKKLGIPIISHESDLSFGLANKIILKQCDVMCTTFLQTSKHSEKCVYTGQPIRPEVLNGNPAFIRSKFSKANPTLLALGGSLGARFINDFIWNNLESLVKNYNIIHIVGKNNKKDVSLDNYLQLEFSDKIGDLYSACDVVISRAGSGVINELLTLRKPMLLIPLSKKCSRGDQIENATLFKKLGYSEIILEEEFSNEKVLSNLNKLIKNKDLYIKNMKKSSINNANEKIVEIIRKTERKSN